MEVVLVSARKYPKNISTLPEQQHMEANCKSRMWKMAESHNKKQDWMNRRNNPPSIKRYRMGVARWGGVGGEESKTSPKLRIENQFIGVWMCWSGSCYHIRIRRWATVGRAEFRISIYSKSIFLKTVSLGYMLCARMHNMYHTHKN